VDAVVAVMALANDHKEADRERRDAEGEVAAGP
jgi:hypothetical protein